MARHVTTATTPQLPHKTRASEMLNKNHDIIPKPEKASPYG